MRETKTLTMLDLYSEIKYYLKEKDEIEKEIARLSIAGKDITASVQTYNQIKTTLNDLFSIEVTFPVKDENR